VNFIASNDWQSAVRCPCFAVLFFFKFSKFVGYVVLAIVDSECEKAPT